MTIFRETGGWEGSAFISLFNQGDKNMFSVRWASCFVTAVVVSRAHPPFHVELDQSFFIICLGEGPSVITVVVDVAEMIS